MHIDIEKPSEGKIRKVIRKIRSLSAEISNILNPMSSIVLSTGGQALTPNALCSQALSALCGNKGDLESWMSLMNSHFKAPDVNSNIVVFFEKMSTVFKLWGDLLLNLKKYYDLIDEAQKAVDAVVNMYKTTQI